MSAIEFNGKTFVRGREALLAKRISRMRVQPRLASLVFTEDEAGMTYTDLKRKAANKVGIEFDVEEASIQTPVLELQQKVEELSKREDLHGVIVQKPSKDFWAKYHRDGSETMSSWWNKIVSGIDPAKDVDCLTPTNLEKVYQDDWKILPATVKAILSVLIDAEHKHKVLKILGTEFNLRRRKAVIVGRSEIVGKPLAAVLEQHGAEVNLYGKDLDHDVLKKADIVVMATGKAGIVNGEHLKKKAVLIDAGFPDSEFEYMSAKEVGSFITPVPNGVGPVTVISLLENVATVLEEGV